MKLSPIARAVSLAGYLGLVITIATWYGWLAPSGLFGRWLVVSLLAPLAFPLPGLLRGRPYTHAWASMMSLFYIVVAMTDIIASPRAHAYAYSVLVTASAFFLGCIFYVRFVGRERRTGAPRHRGERWRHEVENGTET